MLSLIDHSITEYKSTIDSLKQINNIRTITFDELTLLSKIGEGGQSTVYEGYFENNHVAIKILKNIDYNCLMHEITIISNLYHNYIPKFYGMLEDDKKIGFIMEYIKGKDLEHINVFDISYDNKIKVLQCIGSVLEFLHLNSFIHRDLKPANIIIADNFDAYLLDFGISKICINKQNSIVQTKGTTEYLAPECFDIKKIGENDNIISVINNKVDVWAFGCLVSYLFTGVRPWDNIINNTDNNYCEVIESLKEKKEFPIPDILKEKKYKEIYNIIKACTRINPLERASMRSINDMLYSIPELNGTE